MMTVMELIRIHIISRFDVPETTTNNGQPCKCAAFYKFIHQVPDEGKLLLMILYAHQQMK